MKIQDVLVKDRATSLMVANKRDTNIWEYTSMLLLKQKRANYSFFYADIATIYIYIYIHIFLRYYSIALYNRLA